MQTFNGKKLKKIGWEAQSKLAPSYREIPLTQKEIDKRNPKHAAVLCLWFVRNNRWCLPLILRAEYEGVHSAQVAFPGGAFENEDYNYKQTAIRETNEELGIFLSNSLETFALSDLYIPPSNFLVHPFMAFTERDYQFEKDEVEVEEIIVIDKEELREVSIQYEELEGKTIPYFTLQNHKVWGATAMILSEVKEIIFVSL